MDIATIIDSISNSGWKIVNLKKDGKHSIINIKDESSFSSLYQNNAEHLKEKYKHSRLMAGLALSGYVRENFLTDKSNKVVGYDYVISYDEEEDDEFLTPITAYISTWTPMMITTTTLYISRKDRSKESLNQILKNAVIRSIGIACNITNDISKFDPFTGIEKSSHDNFFDDSDSIEDALSMLNKDEVKYFLVDPFGYVRFECGSTKYTILSGSFNPLHKGHERLVRASEKYNKEGSSAFELSVFNSEKLDISSEEVYHRLSQFAGQYLIFVTNQGNFLDKSRILPSATFVVGFDTAQRILDVKFYNNNESELLESIKELRERTKFIVGGRYLDGKFRVASDLVCPDIIDDSMRDLFLELTEEEFREDISSTSLRESS